MTIAESIDRDIAARSAPAPGALDLRPLRHPSEEPRLLLALSATAIVFGLAGLLVVTGGGSAALGAIVAAIGVLAAFIWLVLQVVRARMLGRAVKVTPETLPELHAALQDVRRQLEYDQRLDVYVIEKHTPSTSLTTYLGTRILVLEGNLIADLMAEDPAQIRFLLGRFIGSLKARHHVLTPVEIVLVAVEQLRFLNLFLRPYYRATAYSGDQIALHASGSFSAALSATQRLLVGRQIEPQVRAEGVIAQAGLVRRRVLPRLAQLFLAEPHLTNRYLNLLLFARRSKPEAWAAFRDGLDARAAQQLDVLEARSAHRPRAGSARRRASTAAAFASATVAILAGGAFLVLSARAEDSSQEWIPAASTTAPTGGLLEGSSEVLAPIPDDDAAGVYDPIVIQGAGTVDALEVDVSITHPYVGDLRLQLVAPSGRSALLQEESDDDSSDLEMTYGVADAPALATLMGEPAAGEWRLEVADVSEEDAGTLNAWSLRVQAS